jgi:hypothetical protein
MSLRANVFQGLRSLFRKRAIESEMDEELSAFVKHPQRTSCAAG